MASPLLMLVTRAGIWFRALSCMIVTPETLLALLARSAAYRPTLSPASPASREAGHGRRVTMRGEAGPGERLAMPVRCWRGRGLRLLPQPRRQRPSALSNASAVLAGTRPAPATATTTSAPERAQQCQRGTGGDAACACYRNHDVSARARSAMPARYWRGRGLRLLPQPRRRLGAFRRHRPPGPARRPAAGNVVGHAVEAETRGDLVRALVRLMEFCRMRDTGEAVAAQRGFHGVVRQADLRGERPHRWQVTSSSLTTTSPIGAPSTSTPTGKRDRDTALITSADMTRPHALRDRLRTRLNRRARG